MLLRVEQGKRRKDRYAMLSPKMLELLRHWWRIERPKVWLFPGRDPIKPLSTRLAVVELIGATTTKAGLKVACVLDERTYEKGIRVSDSEMDELDIAGDAFHPEWNYTIKPRHPTKP
jgi:hypothetical protein